MIRNSEFELKGISINERQSDQPPNNMDAADWRSELRPDSRNWIVNKITETLKRHFELSCQEGLVEVKKIAVRFEEKIYNAASSPCDYLTKITMKLLPMENISHNTTLGSSAANSASGSRNPTKPVPRNMQVQGHYRGQAIPMPLSANQPQHQQQHNLGVQANLHQMHMLHQSKGAVPQQNQQPATSLLANQGQHSQPLQPQIITQIQSQSAQLPQQLGINQQPATSLLANQGQHSQPLQPQRITQIQSRSAQLPQQLGINQQPATSLLANQGQLSQPLQPQRVTQIQSQRAQLLQQLGINQQPATSLLANQGQHSQPQRITQIQSRSAQLPQQLGINQQPATSLLANQGQLSQPLQPQRVTQIQSKRAQLLQQLGINQQQRDMWRSLQQMYLSQRVQPEASSNNQFEGELLTKHNGVAPESMSWTNAAAQTREA